MTIGIVYLAKNKISGKCYCGQTTRTLEIRKIEHLKGTIKDGFKFGRALRKYPIDSWEWSILIEVDAADLDENERFFIRDLDSNKSGYNCNDGGGFKGTGNPRYDTTIYELWHPEFGEIRETISDLCKRHSSFSKHFSGLIKGKRQHINGYVLLKNKDSYQDIIRTYDFYHPEVGVVNCTTKELFDTYNKCFKSKENRIHMLTNRTVSIHHGWCLAENKDKYEDILDPSKYLTLWHPELGTKTLKRSEWKKQYKMSDSAMTYLVNGKYKSSHNWRYFSNPDKD